MEKIRQGFIRTGKYLPTEAAQRLVLVAAGVDPERVEVVHTSPRRKKLAYESPHPQEGLPAVFRRCLPGDEVAVALAAVLAAGEPAVRQALVDAQVRKAAIYDCDAKAAIITFADAEAFVLRAKKGWGAGRAAHARKFGGAKPGAKEKVMLVSKKQAAEWWHDMELTKEWIEEKTGVSRRTLSKRFGNRELKDAKIDQ